MVVSFGILLLHPALPAVFPTAFSPYSDALIAQCVLASANLAVQPLRDMLIDGRGFPLSLFLLTIAATGERKSAVDQVVLRPHRDAEYQADKDMDSLCALHEMELAAWEKEKSVLINDGKRTAEEKQFALEQLQRRKPKKPLDQKRLVSDFTFEGMYKLFQAGVRRPRACLPMRGHGRPRNAAGNHFGHGCGSV